MIFGESYHKRDSRTEYRYAQLFEIETIFTYLKSGCMQLTRFAKLYFIYHRSGGTTNGDVSLR